MKRLLIFGTVLGLAATSLTLQADSLSENAESWGNIIGANFQGHPNLDDPETEIYVRSKAVSDGILDQAEIVRFVTIALAQAKKAGGALQIVPSVNPETIKYPASTAPESLVATTRVPVAESVSTTNVISAITKNRWTADSLIVSGTLTNTSTVAVRVDLTKIRR